MCKKETSRERVKKVTRRDFRPFPDAPISRVAGLGREPSPAGPPAGSHRPPKRLGTGPRDGLRSCRGRPLLPTEAGKRDFASVRPGEDRNLLLENLLNCLPRVSILESPTSVPTSPPPGRVEEEGRGWVSRDAVGVLNLGRALFGFTETPVPTPSVDSFGTLFT